MLKLLVTIVLSCFMTSCSISEQIPILSSKASERTSAALEKLEALEVYVKERLEGPEEMEICRQLDAIKRDLKMALKFLAELQIQVARSPYLPESVQKELLLIVRDAILTLKEH